MPQTQILEHKEKVLPVFPPMRLRLRFTDTCDYSVRRGFIKMLENHLGFKRVENTQIWEFGGGDPNEPNEPDKHPRPVFQFRGRGGV